MRYFSLMLLTMASRTATLCTRRLRAQTGALRAAAVHAATDDDAKKRDRAIAEAIPTDADQLFKATVDWAAVLLPVSCIFIKLIMLYRWSARASSRPSYDRGSPKKSPSIWGKRSPH